ncbi:dihydrodipicolinate synthase family protein [Actinoplanes regularis]|uniref:dihydrodipicolinate synthase family protein n=1 Tax=Actinoplanes regularis TaxID=52697 RepID=UPI00255650B6|nr:dihydrodipicolinate synthase family protein [Actinoplanes regularis]
MELTGVFVPMITPFDESGAVAYPALESLAHQILETGATGLVALGTTGEPSALTPGEQHGILTALSKVCAHHHAPLLAGAHPGEEFPQVTAMLSLVPPFVRPGPAGVLAHFTALAATSPVPLVIYHVPPRTGQPLDSATLRAIGTLDRVLGIKYATGTLDADAIALLADPPPNFAVLSGDDIYLSPLLALGATGGILASAHLATDRFVALVTAWRTGDVSTARKLGHELTPLSTALFAEPNPTVIKAVLHAQGRIPTPSVRLPLLPASPAALHNALRYAG